MQKQFEYNNSQVFYTVTGNGKPVVLLHGFAEDGSVWNDQVAFLRQHCLLIVPDLPGSGSSDLLQKENVTIEDYAACLHALLTIENISSCIVLGHSMGGYITLAFAEMFPGKLAAFGFVHSSAFADTEDKKNTRKKGISFIEQHGVYPFLKNATPNLFAEAYKKDHSERVEALIEQGKNFSKKALIHYYTAMMNRPDRTSVLKESKVPVLFVAGSEDVAAPLKDVVQQVHLPAISFIHIIQQAGHMSMWEKPGELNNHLLAFIEAVSS